MSKIWETEQLDQFCSRMSRLLGVGMTAQEAVSLLMEDERYAVAKEELAQLYGELLKGKTLSLSMKAAGGFPHHVLQMVEIGETAGRLEQVLEEVAQYNLRERETRGALRRAIGYPALMAGLLVAVFALVLTQVLPIFARVFAQTGAGVPVFLQQLMNLGTAGRLVLMGVCGVLIILSGVLMWRIEKGKRLPLGRKARLTIDRSRYAAALAMLVRSGVPLDKTLTLSAELVGEGALAEAGKEALRLFTEGIPLSKALEQSGVLSPTEAGMLAVGMRSGKSDEALDELSLRCAEEADTCLNQTLGCFEFALILALCAMVAMLLLAVIMPLLGVLTAIG